MCRHTHNLLAAGPRLDQRVCSILEEDTGLAWSQEHTSLSTTRTCRVYDLLQDPSKILKIPHHLQLPPYHPLSTDAMYTKLPFP